MAGEKRDAWTAMAPRVRFGGMAGVVFVVLTIVSAAIVPGAPAADATPKAITGYYLEHHDALVASSILSAVAVVFLLVLLSAVRHALHIVEGAEGFLADTVFGAGVLLAAVLVIDAVLTDALAQRIVNDGGATVSGTFEIALLVGKAGTALPIGVLILATSIIGVRAHLMPQLRLIASLGAVVGVLSIAGAIAVLGNDTSGLSVLTTLAFDSLVAGATVMSGVLIGSVPPTGPTPHRSGN
jgi:hypothetical protein